MQLFIRVLWLLLLGCVSRDCLFSVVYGQETNPTETTQAPVSAVPDEPGLSLLDKAMEEKMSASRMGDLDRVVELCEQALDKGLGEANQKFAIDLLVACYYEKANRLIEPALDGNIDGSWDTRRSLAEKALDRAIEKDPQHGESYLLLSELHQLPGGDADAGREAAAKAVDLLAENPVRQAEAYLIQSDYTTDPVERLNFLDKAVDLDSANLETWKERAFARSEQGKLEEAVADFRHVLEVDPDDKSAMEALARVLATQENYVESQQLTEKLIAASPDSPQPLVLRAGILLVQGKMDEALKDADAALSLEPENLNLLFMRARILASMPKFDDALATIEQILKLSPNVPQVLELRVGIYVEQKKFKEAAEDVTSLLTLDPQNIDLTRQLAALYLAGDRPRRAIEEYTRLVELSDNIPATLRGRADAYLAIGEHAKAIDDYEKALEAEPNDDSVLNNLAWVLATSPIDSVRNGQRAIELATRACEKTDYKAAHVLSTLAASYAETGDFVQAIEWSKKAVELSDADTKNQLEAELKSYEENKPWRELTKIEESEDPPVNASDDDFDLSADIGAIESKSDDTELPPAKVPQRIPSDP